MRSAAMAVVLLCASVSAAHAQADRARYSTAAPMEQYRSPSRAEEIALARSAAPSSISADAEILVLGEHGYETAVTGTNGFVCFVERSWAAGLDDPEFWNPKVRAPNCFNAIAARTELPQYLTRTQWALVGASREAIRERTRSSYAGHRFVSPEPGALSYMLSKRGYLGDAAAGPWLPHVMLFVPHGEGAAWGAGADGSPIMRFEGSAIESTILMIPVRQWSDGSIASAPAR